MGEHLIINRMRHREARHTGFHSGSFEPCKLQLPATDKEASHNSLPPSHATKVKAQKSLDERFAFLEKKEGLQNQPDGKNYSIESDGTIVLKTNSDSFRFNYAMGGSSQATSFDKNFESLHPSKTKPNEQITKRTADSRYSYSVTKLADGTFEYRIKLNQNCQGIRMDFGDGTSYQFEKGVTNSAPTPSATERYNSDSPLSTESSTKKTETSPDAKDPAQAPANSGSFDLQAEFGSDLILGPRPRILNDD